MATIKPFKGLRYNIEKVGGLEHVVTPPYDIISDEEQKAYYDKHPNNVIRLEYGAEYETDSELDNRYTRAAAFLRTWIDDNVLQFEDKECLYLYEQRFSFLGQELTYRGFVTLTQLEEFSKGFILPHEETLSKAKTDRLNLMTATHANFSQIYCLYMDETGKIRSMMEQITKSPADISFTAENDILQKYGLCAMMR